MQMNYVEYYTILSCDNTMKDDNLRVELKQKVVIGCVEYRIFVANYSYRRSISNFQYAKYHR